MEIHTVKRIALTHDDVLDILAKKFRCNVGEVVIHVSGDKFDGAIITMDQKKNEPVNKRDLPIRP